MPRTALLRRALTVPAVTLGFLLAAALLPVALPLALVSDVLRGAGRTLPSTAGSGWGVCFSMCSIWSRRILMVP